MRLIKTNSGLFSFLVIKRKRKTLFTRIVGFYIKVGFFSSENTLKII